MYLKEIGWKGVEWIYLAQEINKWRAHGSEPSGSTKCAEFLYRLRNLILRLIIPVIREELSASSSGCSSPQYSLCHALYCALLYCT